MYILSFLFIIILRQFYLFLDFIVPYAKFLFNLTNYLNHNWFFMIDHFLSLIDQKVIFNHNQYHFLIFLLAENKNNIKIFILFIFYLFFLNNVLILLVFWRHFYEFLLPNYNQLIYHYVEKLWIQNFLY